MEQDIVQRLCPGMPVRLIGCNGHDVTMAALSKVLDARLRRLKNYRPVVIIVDRERRSQPASALVSELCQLLNASQTYLKFGA